MPIADQSHKLNVAILNKELAKKAWYNTFFAKLAGFMDETEVNGIKQHVPVPNKVIQVMREFIAQGRDNMLMPMELPLEEPGVYGDGWLKGTGEDIQLRYLQLYVNQWRKAVTKLPGVMSNQRIKIYHMMERAMPALIRWWSHTENQAIFQSFYEGLSPNLTAGTNDDGLGLKARFHPNWYYVAAAPETITTVGTEKFTKTQAELTEDLTQANAGPQTYKTLHALAELITGNLLIDPVVHDGSDPFWFYLVSNRTFTKFMQDTTIKADQNSAYNAKLMTHPAINGRRMLYYGGFCIMPDPIGIRRVQDACPDAFLDLAGGNLRKGWLKPSPGAYPISNNIILGSNAMGKGIASSMEYTEEHDDHGNVKEIGSNQIVGYNRAEFFSDTDSANVYSTANATKSALDTAYEAINQSSMIVSSED